MAATNIQDAVDAAVAGDEIVVTNGVYAGGLAVNTPLALRGANGPQLTIINGGRTNRCVSLTDGASLTGFTLTNGIASTNGVGNITNAPLFVDCDGGNLRLQSNSPCINTGRNAYAPGATDLDGFPRIVSGTVDMGAYEFQGTGSRISYAWLQHYGLPTDGSADFLDLDADGHNNWQEWRCGTDPANELSVLRLLTPVPAMRGVVVSWQSVANRNYFLQRSSDLGAQPAFSTLQSNILGQPGTTVYTDTTATNAVPYCYRVAVQ